MKNEQEIVRSVFDAYIRDAKATSTKKDRPTFDMLEKVKNRAIKALEQQTSDDCVSRQAAINEIKSMSNANPSYWATCDVIDREDLIDNIQALPPVTPTQKWIPISEGLPKPQKDGDSNFTDWVQVSIRINPYQSIVCSAYYCFSEAKWYMERMGCGEIVAWQPLPKPYEEKRGDSDGSN